MWLEHDRSVSSLSPLLLSVTISIVSISVAVSLIRLVLPFVGAVAVGTVHLPPIKDPHISNYIVWNMIDFIGHFGGTGVSQ